MSQDIQTTKGELFTSEDHKMMASLIFRRFGRNVESFCNAWRRLLENNAENFEIMKLIPNFEDSYNHPDGRKLTYFEASQSSCTHTSPCPSCAVSSDDMHEYLDNIVLNPSEEKL